MEQFLVFKVTDKEKKLEYAASFPTYGAALTFSTSRARSGADDCFYIIQKLNIISKKLIENYEKDHSS